MHGPMTVAFEIRVPFTGKKNAAGGYIKYPYLLATIWHVDPEADGSDDSCDWFGGRKFPDEIKEKIKGEGEKEWDYWFGARSLYNAMRFASDVEIIWAVWSHVAWFFGKKWKDRTTKEINEIFQLTANPTDNIDGSIRDAKASKEGLAHLFMLVYGCYVRLHRPWYMHPRWHIYHWQIQIQPLNDFKRWAFSRCAHCGKRFPWGYSPTTTNWNSKGPRWFRSEEYVYHSRCVPVKNQVSPEVPNV